MTVRRFRSSYRGCCVTGERVIPDVLEDRSDRRLLALLNHEGGGTTFLENVHGTTQTVTQSNKTRRPESSAVLMREPQILQFDCTVITYATA